MESDITHQIWNYKDNLTIPTWVDPEQNLYVEVYSISVPEML